MAGSQWAIDRRKRIGRAIRTAREQAGLTADVVAEIATGGGYPLTRDMVINIELGRKKSIDVCELLILAEAMGVPGLSLLFPDLVDTLVEVLPNTEKPSGDAALGFCGYLDDDGDMKTLFRLHDARRQFEFDPDEAARQMLAMAKRLARKQGWQVDG